MKKILILLLTISGLLNAQTLLDPSIVSAINSTCCGASASGTIYVDSVSSNSAGDSLIVYKNGTRYAYRYPSGGGSAYTLPIATTSILGGVKDGSGVSIASDGTISAEVQTFAQNGSNFIVTTYDTAGGVTPQTFTWTAPDFWRKSTPIPTLANTMPNGVNDTNTYIQHRSDIFIGGADGLVRAGQGSGNVATNTVFGKNALRSNTTGSNIVAIGNNAVGLNTTGFWNVGIGSGSLSANTTGNFNVSMGGNSMQTNTSGNNNTGIGTESLKNNTSGGNNTALGMQSLMSNTTATNNTAFGQQSLRNNTTGNGNTAVGSASLLNQTTATGNVAVGFLAGQNITTGNHNVAISPGFGTNGSARGLKTGSDNITIGLASAIGTPGFGAGPLDGTASADVSRNILIGGATANNLANNENIAIGFGSADIGNGTKNVILGSYSLGPNTGSGWSTPANLATNNNTIIGSDYNKSALAQVAIGNNNTALGFNINQRIVGITNSTAIGANTASTKSNQISMGDSNVTEIFLGGKLAIDINAIFGAADGTPIVVKTVGGIKTITVQ